jgi:protein SCO1/2
MSTQAEKDKGIRNTLLSIAGFISLILGLLMAAYMSPKQLSADEFRELGFYQFDTPRVIQDFDLVNDAGEKVTLESLKNQWSLLFFGFTYCPDVCPTTLSVLNEVVNNLENPPQVIMVSVDPERDTPEVLAKYVPRFNPEFTGYTGDFDEIVSLATEVNVAFGKVPGPTAGSYQVEHSASIVVINPGGHYAGFIKAPHNAQNIQKIVSNL